MGFIYNSKTYTLVRDKKTFYLKTIASSDSTQVIDIVYSSRYIIELIGGGSGGIQKIADTGSTAVSGGSGGYIKALYSLNEGDILYFRPGSGGAGVTDVNYDPVIGKAGKESFLQITRDESSWVSITSGGAPAGVAKRPSETSLPSTGGINIIHNNTSIERIISNTSIAGRYVTDVGYSHPEIERTLSPMTYTLTGYGSGGGTTSSGATGGDNGGFKITGIYDYPIEGYTDTITSYQLCPLIYNNKFY